MPHLSAEAKHHILLEYARHSSERALATLAQRHAISGGARTLRRWRSRWDGTPQSLQRISGSGRPRALSSAEVARHVRAPILAKNRAHKAVQYTELLSGVRQRTGKNLSLRTLQRYGKEELGAKKRHTTKRTADESECGAGQARVAPLLLLMLNCSVC